MHRYLILVFLLLPLVTFSQKEVIAGESVERIFRDADKSQNFYLLLEPAGRPKGLAIILPGYGGYPREILDGSTIAGRMRKEGFLVVLPFLKEETFYIDSIALHRLETLVSEVMTKYKVDHDKLIIGGHSAGGNAALLYAAKSFRLSRGELIRPAIVFAVDPPLDMKRFHNTVSHEIAINYRKKVIDDMKEFLSVFEDMFGGPPSIKGDVYQKYSGYSRDDVDGGNTKYLAEVPIRLYCDPDVQWSIEHLGVGYEHLNASDLSECIATLKRLGNKNAELVINLGKGFDSDGNRNPHAASQLNVEEFVKWIARYMK